MSNKKNGLIYLLSNIANAGLSFILLPILTRALTKDDYGKVALFMMVISLMPVFVELCTAGSITRKYYDDSKEGFSSFVGTVFKTIFTGACVTTIIVIVFKDFIELVIPLSYEWILFAIVVSLCNSVISVRLGQWQVRQQAIKYGVFNFIKVFLTFSLSLIFVVYLESGAEGQVLSLFTGSLVMAIAASYLLYKNKIFSFEKNKPNHLREILNYGFGLIPHVLGGFLLLSADRYILDKNLGLSAVAIYMVAYQLSSVLGIVFDAANKAFVPWLFALLKRNNYNEKAKLVKYTYLSMLLLLVITIMAFLIGPYMVVLIASEKYKQAGEIIGYLCLGQAFNGMYLMVTNYIFFSKKTKFLSVATILSGLINVALMLVLIEYNGLVGVAQAYAIGQFLRFSSTWLLSARVYSMPWLTFFKQSDSK